MKYPIEVFAKKLVILISLLLLITIGALVYVTWIKTVNTNISEILNPFAILNKKDQQTPPKEPINIFSSSLTDKEINIALLGIDRRSKFESAYRTDTMVILSINVTKNRILLISIPRDLWVENSRVNALYIQGGWESLQSAFKEITGLEVDNYILTDFEDFAWIIDSFGGVEVAVENSFVDSQYPVDVTKTYQTVAFEQGTEVMDGQRALIFSRSRKGTNGEGSDWARMKRQHLLLKGMVGAVLQPKSIFNPMNVEQAYKMITDGRMDTSLTLSDAYYLWDMYKDKDKYTYVSLFLDSDYVFNPPMEDYGGAWVLAPIDPTYAAFHNKVKEVVNQPVPSTLQ
ncbi:hypothetical protein A2415_04710 [candidate division WWE3 bacterium RIFOXYC1_FULL_39_7]|uniref:Cell envelope-related transcriptional attenuator domain-containing protein n=2 Tax=Katanobacteria TaxID=422282 RepID=A0A1F4X6M0_UNCKA|nr:MAG: hypothetical protein A2415_04710 [candidate division WWE3 bacterium RIFOXYC1_FULL_39_7]OGC77302.1 MAG: hypothetical protein A2619_04670 [candidate division WWE3 bacterium RIFOXYD1_FULL_39_9]